MAKLIFYFDNAVLNEFPLENERTTLGRRATNDIQIDNLAVSGEHAVILRKGDDFYIEDCESTNGTEVNAKLIKSHLLQSDDLIIFGKHKLKFFNQVKLQNKSNNNTAFEKTVMMRLDESKNVKLKPILEPVPCPTSSILVIPVTPSKIDSSITMGKIQVLNGSSVGRELILNKALTTIGEMGIQVAVITKRPHGYFLTHVEGKIFPSVNGSSIGAQSFELSDHDVIELESVKMEFYLDKI